MDTVFKLAVIISAVDHASAYIDRVAARFRLLGNASEDTLRRLDRLKKFTFAGGLLAGVGVAGIIAVTSALKDVTKEAMEFEDVMNNVKIAAFGKDLLNMSKAGEIKQTLKELEHGFEKIGIATKFSDTGVAEAALGMLKGGVSKEFLLGMKGKDGYNYSGLTAAIYSAQLGGVGTQEAGDFIAKQKAAFNMSGDRTLQAANFYAKTAAASTMDYAQVMSGMLTSSGVAGTLGMTPEDAVKILAATGTYTKDGASAGTFTKDFLDRLIPKTKKQKGAMDQLGWLKQDGTSIFFDDKGQTKGADYITQILQETRKKINNPAAFQSLMSKVFLEQGKVTALALASDSNIYTQVSKNIANQLDMYQQIEIQMSGTKNLMETMMETWKIAKRVIGEPFLDPLKTAFRGLNKYLGDNVVVWAKAHPQMIKYIGAALLATSVTLTVVGVIMMLVGIMGILRIIMVASGITWTMVATKTLLAFGAFALVAGIAYLVYKNWDTVKGLWERYGIVIKVVAGLLILAYVPAMILAAYNTARMAIATSYAAAKTLALAIYTRSAAIITGAYRSILLIVTVAQWLYAAATGAVVITTTAQRIALVLLAPVILTMRGLMLIWTAAQWALNIAMDANPIGAVILLIVALIGVVILIIKYWDTWWTALKGFAAKIPGWAVVVLAVFVPIIGIPLLIAKYWDKAVDAVKKFLGIKAEAEKQPPKPPEVPKGAEVKIPTSLEMPQNLDDITKMLGTQGMQGLEIPTSLDVGDIEKQVAALNAGGVPDLSVPANVNTEELNKQVAAIGGTKVPDLNVPANLDVNGLTNQVNKQMPELGNNTSAEYAKGIDSGLPKVADAVKRVTETVKSNLPTAEQMNTLGLGVAHNLAAGISSGSEGVTSAAKSLADKVIGTVKASFGIQSPSTVFHGIGINMIQGLINGLKANDLKGMATDIFGDIPSALGGVLSGGGAVSGNVTQWLSAALALTGTSQSWLPGLQRLVAAESGGNPTVVNSTPVGKEHATGLLQTLPSTFRANAAPGMGDINNPVHNAAAAINYIKGRYGSVYNTPLFRSGGKYVGYATGGIINQKHLAYVGEEGPESIIPLSNNRNRALSLWEKTGHILGALSPIRSIRNILGANQGNMPIAQEMTQTAQTITVNSHGNGGSVPSIKIESGAIVIQASPEQSADDIAQAVVKKAMPLIAHKYEQMIRDKRRNTGKMSVGVV